MVYAWDRTYGGKSTMRAVTIDGAGNIYARGFSADGGLFVLSLTPDGAPRWRHTYGASLFGDPGGIAVDSSSNVYVSGRVMADTDFGDGILSGSSNKAFILSLSSEGAYRWVRLYSLRELGSIAVDGVGNVVAVSSFSALTDFGGGERTSNGGVDAAVWSLDSDGTYRWDRTFGGAGDDAMDHVAVSDDGSVTAVGVFEGPADFGGGNRTETRGLFALRLTSRGAYLWDRSVALAASDGHAVALDADANAYVTGYFHGSVDFGDGPHESRLWHDTLLWSLDRDGAHRWTSFVGDERYLVRGKTVAVGGTGEAVVGGHFATAVDFGGGEREGNSSASAFLWGVATTGDYAWDYVVRGSSHVDHRGVVHGPDGSVIVVGNFSDSADFGGGVRVNDDSNPDAFILRLEPAR